MAYNPSKHTASNKSYGLLGKPIDARSYYYDDDTFSYRPFNSKEEVLEYFNTEDSRKGNFLIFIKLSELIEIHWFKDGFEDSDLIPFNVSGVLWGAISGDINSQTDLINLLNLYQKKPNGAIDPNSVIINVDDILDGIIRVTATDGWRIDGIDYLPNSTIYTFNDINLSTVGRQRYIIFYGDTDGNIYKIEGEESEAAFIPNNPDNTAMLGTALITDIGSDIPVIDDSNYAKLFGGNIFNGKQIFNNDIIVSHGRFGSIRLAGHYQGEPETQRFRIAAYQPTNNNVFFTRINDTLPSYPNDLEWDYNTGIFDFKQNPTVNGQPIDTKTYLNSLIGNINIVEGNNIVITVDSDTNAITIHSTASDAGLPTLTLNTTQELQDYILSLSNKQDALDTPYKGNGAYLYITQDDIDNISVLNPFTFIAKTDNTGSLHSNNNQLKLPIDISLPFDFTVDWGDGNVENFNNSTTSQVLHTYNTAGTYTIKCTGNIDSFDFSVGGGTDYNKILEVLNWGNIRFKNLSFKDCNNLILTNVSDVLDTTDMISFDYMFYGCRAITYINRINEWETSNITSMTHTFSNAVNFNQDLTNWDTSEVVYFNNTFENAYVFNGDISTWNTPSAISMASMFNNARLFNGDISNWITTNVSNMYNIFCDAKVFNGNISSWNTSNVTSMSQMFIGATAFNQPIGVWNVSNVTNMQQMFNGATSFNQDISDWNVSKVDDFNFFMSGKWFVNYNSSYLDNIYNKWSIIAKTGKTISFGSIKYTPVGEVGKNTLLEKGWSISDGGLI